MLFFVVDSAFKGYRRTLQYKLRSCATVANPQRYAPRAVSATLAEPFLVVNSMFESYLNTFLVQRL